jgi:hypothetical protein
MQFIYRLDRMIYDHITPSVCVFVYCTGIGATKKKVTKSYKKVKREK